MRNTFKNFRVKDLSGGLNVNTSANQIDDKQCTQCVNFNFEGNKLVTAKGIIEAYDLVNSGPIKGLAVDGFDVYWVHSANVYKNGTKINTSTNILTVTVANSATYTVTLNGTRYTYISDRTATEIEILNGLYSAIPSTYYKNVDRYLNKYALFLNGYATITVTGNITQTASIIIPDREYNMDIWNGFVILTSIEKNGTSNDRPIWIKNGASSFFTTQYDDTPTLCRIYNGKLILSGYQKVGNTLLHSKTASATNPFDLFEFGAYNGGSILLGDGAPVTALEVGENGLYAFKHTEIWYSNSEKDDGTSFDLIFKKITGNGAVNQGVVSKVRQEVIYYDDINKAVRRLGYEENLTTLRDSSISKEIEPILRMLPKQASPTSSYKYPNYKLFLRSDVYGKGSNDVCFVYNVDTKSWAIETNKNCSYAADGYLGSPYYNKIYKDDETYSLYDLGKERIFLSKEYDIGDGIDFKRFGELEIMGKISGSITATVDVVIDGETVDSRTLTGNEGRVSTLGTSVLGIGALGIEIQQADALTEFRERYDLYNDGRRIQFRITTNGLGYIEISNVNFRYKAIAAYPDYY